VDREIFESVDRYIEGLFVPDDAALKGALAATNDAGMPAIQVSPSQGKFLYLLTRMCGARRILEVGALGGYSTIWLARALPSDGALISLEVDPKHADVARTNLARAGFTDNVEVRVGSALDTLPQLAVQNVAPFDLIFIDADKANYPAYLDHSLRLTRRGSVIIADNVVRQGAVLQSGSLDESLMGLQQFNAALAADPRVEAIVVQMVGAKGHDGMAIAVAT